jgi:hypothetical protein
LLPHIRQSCGAVFCDHRFGQIVQNRDEAGGFCQSRGFRGKLTVALPAAG